MSDLKKPLRRTPVIRDQHLMELKVLLQEGLTTTEILDQVSQWGVSDRTTMRDLSDIRYELREEQNQWVAKHYSIVKNRVLSELWELYNDPAATRPEKIKILSEIDRISKGDKKDTGEASASPADTVLKDKSSADLKATLSLLKGDNKA